MEDTELDAERNMGPSQKIGVVESMFPHSSMGDDVTLESSPEVVVSVQASEGSQTDYLATFVRESVHMLSS